MEITDSDPIVLGSARAGFNEPALWRSIRFIRALFAAVASDVFPYGDKDLTAIICTAPVHDLDWFGVRHPYALFEELGAYVRLG